MCTPIMFDQLAIIAAILTQTSKVPYSAGPIMFVLYVRGHNVYMEGKAIYLHGVQGKQ